jgi:phosphoribosylamine--glycine ligase
VKVLVVGSGGREHALTWALRRSPRLGELYVAPGNGGTGSIAANVDIDPLDVDGLLAFANEHDIDLTIVGPEAPLVAGIVDRFHEGKRRCFGPSASAARLEGSKVFAKEFMKRHGIPTADFVVCADANAALAAVEKLGTPVVVKADGLAAGKGVVVAKTKEEAGAAIDDIMVSRKFGGAGERVVIEECLEGEEVSVHAVCAGVQAAVFPTSQDHKRIFDGDAGPNTGGMGAYAPVPFITPDQRRDITKTIINTTLRGMKQDGVPFSGVLYAGLMMTSAGPKVLEYNVRFGDPETQALLPLLKSDLLWLLSETEGGELPDNVEFFEDRSVATVVVASEGYPGSYEKGKRVTGLDAAQDDAACVVFHAGTSDTGEGLVTSGGRVFAVTAWDEDLPGALRRAYERVERIEFSGAYWRKDIGRRALRLAGKTDGAK